MEEAVYLGRNVDETKLANGQAWEYRFKTVSGKYVFGVDLNDSEQSAPATRFATNRAPGSYIGTKVLVEATMIDGTLFAVQVSLDPNATYQDCDVCCFLLRHRTSRGDRRHTVETEQSFLELLPKLERLEEEGRLQLTAYIDFEELERHYDEHVLSIACRHCSATYGCRIAGEREAQGVHIRQSRYSFVED